MSEQSIGIWAMADAKSELAEIKKMGGKPQKNSGRGLYQKGDATLGPFCVDVKEYAKFFGLSRDVWGKICSDAAKSKKEPALMICLGSGRESTRMWVIGNDMFEQMLAAWKEKYGD
jgi:hypothetical protein